MIFSEAQAVAISHNTGPAMVLAGPGSGKTTVITHRINSLINKYSVDPSNILVITYTKAAAMQMKERFLKLSNNTKTAVAFGTFHAVYFTILKHSKNYSSDCIILPEKQKEIIKDIIDAFQLETADETELINSVLNEISAVKNGRLQLENFHSSSIPEKTFSIVYSKYEKILKNKRLIDFDDMLLDCYRLLSGNDSLLAAWQNKYRYILIDEFQDINQIQFDVINLIAGRNRNIFVVGDDDQSIYGFRGSKPDIMKKFLEQYPEALHIDMSDNYRSMKNIVYASKSIIENNENRFLKNIRAISSKDGKVEVWELNDLEAEYTFVIDRIKELHCMGVKYSDMAVLYRLNSTSATLFGKLIMENIPCQMESKEPNMYEHWIAKDILAYIDAARGNMKRDNILRIINKPMRYITRSYLSNPVSLVGLLDYYTANPDMTERINSLCFDLKMIGKMQPYVAINYIRKAVDYDKYVEDFAREHKVNEDTLFELLDNIQEDAKRHNTVSEWIKHIEHVKEEYKEAAKNVQNKKEGVCMQTMHGSKGLEFRAVFILDVSEGMIPYHKAVLAEEIEEERRMFYVAMTRAKEYLFMTYSKERYNKKTTPSRFIEELNRTYCMFNGENEKKQEIIPAHLPRCTVLHTP